MEALLVSRYNQPVPRYTSYPTVPFWKGNSDKNRWRQEFITAFNRHNEKEGISLYLHLPFCESLCLYCGCNKKITTNHSVEEEYLDAILKEWKMYRQMMEHPPVIRELHLGGGTPTYFSPANLHRLVSTILSEAKLHPEYAFSIEGHPNNTSREHLDTLYALGFRRISYGVQDLNPDIQRIIGRWQPFQRLEDATNAARSAGFTAVNFDLIYGLPAQTPKHLKFTIDQALSLHPDRIAFYSYAHTPTVVANQRLIDPALLPGAGEKLHLYELGKLLLEEKGYVNIGMDHFALPTDELCLAWKAGRLHRNFMGYTVHNGGLLLGLGLSAISDIGTAYAQNDKSLTGYYRSVNTGEPAITKGFWLSTEDQVFKRYILDIACKGETVFDATWPAQLALWTLPRLRALQKDGLVVLDSRGVALTKAGRPFLRHVCKAFDLHLLRDEKTRAGFTISAKQTDAPQFSNAI
jgi:oxygen-independent coproporphyrinogen-3 oxidase